MSLEDIVSLSPEETSFFESGGATEISDTGGNDAGTGVDGSASGSGSDAGAGAGDQGAKGGDKQPQTVPLAALQEERTRRQELDKSHRETQRQLDELKGKFSIIDRLVPGATVEKEAPKGPPSVDEDIFGAVKGQGETVAALAKRLDDADAAKKVADENATFVNTYKADAAQFEVKNPDYKAAYNHVLKSRANELLAIGFDDPRNPALTPAEQAAAAKALHEALVADEHAIATLAMKKGKSAAEIFYGLAKQRGYVKAAPAGDGKGADTGKGAAMLETIERGQNANKSLSNTGGSSGDVEMTAERLLGMPIDEFETWCNSNPAKAKRIMGG